MVAEVAKDLAGSLNLDNLIKSIILTTMGHLLAETGVLFVLDEALGRYTVRAVKGIKEGVDGLSFGTDEALLRELADADIELSENRAGDQCALHVEAIGPGVCHEGYESCFFRRLEDGEWKVVDTRAYDPSGVYGGKS